MSGRSVVPWLVGGTILGVVCGLAMHSVVAPFLKPKVVKSSDGVVQLTLPGLWVDLPRNAQPAGCSLAKGSDLQAMCVVVFNESKTQFDQDFSLARYSDLCVEGMKQGLKGFRAGEPVDTAVGPYAAVQREVRGRVDQKYVYLHTSVETDDHYHQILIWTVPDRLRQNRSQMETITNGFRLVGP